MKKLILSALAAGSALVAAAPASAIVVVPGVIIPVIPTAGVPAGQGTQVASGTFNGQAFTFATTVRYAVYLNTGNTYDFYFQVAQTGAGSTGSNQPIRQLTVSNYAGFTTDVYASAGDPDGAGLFVAANNPNPPIGSTTGVTRSANGQTVVFDFEAFGLNNLVTGETSATYIIRTNATNFNNVGTFGVIDGSTTGGLTFQPTSGVPEPATWALMLLGFGGIGFAMRRRPNTTTRIRFA